MRLPAGSTLLQRGEMMQQQNHKGNVVKALLIIDRLTEFIKPLDAEQDVTNFRY
jgi:hypothetical protein